MTQEEFDLLITADCEAAGGEWRSLKTDYPPECYYPGNPRQECILSGPDFFWTGNECISKQADCEAQEGTKWVPGDLGGTCEYADDDSTEFGCVSQGHTWDGDHCIYNDFVMLANTQVIASSQQGSNAGFYSGAAVGFVSAFAVGTLALKAFGRRKQGQQLPAN